MDSPHTENVLADIEKQFLSIEQDDREDGFVLDEDVYRVIDSFEIGDVDDIHASDASYSHLLGKRRKPSYSRRREDEHSRSYYHRRHSSSKYRRSPRRSSSKVSDYRHPRKSRERRTIERNSDNHIRVSVKNSPRKVDKLPDLKCTTSLETGEVSVVLLSEDISKRSHEDDKDKEACDSGRKRPPTLVKNPFACASLSGKDSLSPEKGKIRPKETSPRITTERCSSERNRTDRNSLERRSMGRHSIEKFRRESVESRSYSSRNRERGFSPVRSRSSRRSSPYFDRGRDRRRSSSRNSERYRGRRMSRDSRRSRDSCRKRRRSRDSSNLSRVSSRSSLSFMSIRDNSPDEHDRKSSPLRPNNFYSVPRQNDQTYFSNSEDFNHKLSLLLSERKHKQLSSCNESGSHLSSNYSNSNWKYENWTNTGSGAYPQSQNAGVNYSSDVDVKRYDQQSAVHQGYSQNQYNQGNYVTSVSQNYSSIYTGNVENSGQFSFNYGNPYQNLIPNQYYPQSSTTVDFSSTSYTNQNCAAQYPPSTTSEEPVVVNCIPQHTSSVSGQQYSVHEQINYVPVDPPPSIDTRPSAFSEALQSKHLDSNNSVANVDLVTGPSESALKAEESDEDAPPPPVISNTWREIELVKESSWEGADQKWSVLGKCEELLKKLMSNDPYMEHFKFPELMLFSAPRVDKTISPNSASRNAISSARRGTKILSNQSPLLRINPPLKFEPWIPEG